MTASDELHRAEAAHEMAHLSYSRIADEMEARTRPGAAAGSRRGTFARYGSRSAGPSGKSKLKTAEQHARVSRADQGRVQGHCTST